MAVVGLLLMAATGATWGHELPDGVVERAIQVVVHPEHIEVEYRFGMSESTMRNVLESWQIQAREPLTELEQQLLHAAAPKVGEQLVVLLDDQRLSADEAQSELIYQHHLQFACRLTFAWDADQPRQLRIADRMFPEMPGHFRVAVKGRWGFPVSSPEAPILVRAPRRATAESLPGEPLGPTIEARIGDSVTNIASTLPPSTTADEAHDSEDAVSPAAVHDDGASAAQTLEANAASPTRSLPWPYWAAIVAALAAATLPWLIFRRRG